MTRIKKVYIFRRVNEIITNHSEDYDNFEILDTQRNKIKKWMLDNLSLGTVENYALRLYRTVESMNVPQSEKDDLKQFYLDIAAETQHLKA